MYYFEKGDDYIPNEDEGISMYIAGIHHTYKEGGLIHGNCIEIYGSTKEKADDIRQFVLNALYTEGILTGE